MTLQSTNIPEVLTLDRWTGMNQGATRSSMDDQECWWIENLVPIGPGNLRAVWGPSAALYTATPPNVIRRIFITCIDGVNPVAFMFLDAGGGVGLVDQVNLNTGAISGLGPIWQPVAPNYWGDVKLWQPNQFGAGPGQSGGCLIGSPQGMYAWDGTNVTAPGAAAPGWLTGGATGQTMPVGLPGIYAMEVYKDRLWVMGQTVVSFSAPGNGSNFSASAGGGSFGYQGDQLRLSYTDIQASAGFLYLFGDSLTEQITDLTLVQAGSPVGPIYAAQFLLSNVDPQVGQEFFRPIAAFGIAFTLWNGDGIYVLTGGQGLWASQKMVPVFASVNSTPFQPTQCPVHIFGTKFILFNATFTDVDGNPRSMMATWTGPGTNQWVMTSQRYALTNICSFEKNSVITAYGTDGSGFYQLFAQPDPALRKRIQTKDYQGQDPQAHLSQKDWKRVYIEYQDNMPVPQSNGVTITGVQRTNGGGLPNGAKDIAFYLDPGMRDIVPAPTDGKGINANLDLSSLSPDFTVARISMTFDARTLFGA